MVEYTCLKCYKAFDRKSNYTRHIKRKYGCVSKKTSHKSSVSSRENGDKNKSGLTCPKCNCSYTRVDVLTKHMRVCDQIPETASECGKTSHQMSRPLRAPDTEETSDLSDTDDIQSSILELLDGRDKRWLDISEKSHEENEGSSNDIIDDFSEDSSRIMIDSDALHRRDKNPYRQLLKRTPEAQKNYNLEPELDDSQSDVSSLASTENRNTCMYCHKVFKKRNSYRVHRNRGCRGKRQYEEQLISNQQLNQHSVNLGDNGQQVTGNVENMNQTNIGNQTNNQTHIENQVININAFGNEDLEHITDEVYKKFIRAGFTSVPKLIDKIHFSPDHKKNHNVYMPSIKDAYAMVRENDGWKARRRNDIVDKLWDRGIDTLEGKFKELVDEISSFAVERFLRVLGCKKNSEQVKNIKNDIRELLYNKRRVVMRTKKEQQKGSQ